jgi:hypothetical protein
VNPRARGRARPQDSHRSYGLAEPTRTWESPRQGTLVSPFTGAGIERLAIRATWLRNASPGSPARVVGYDKQGNGATARTRLDVGGVAFVYGAEGLARI